METIDNKKNVWLCVGQVEMTLFCKTLLFSNYYMIITVTMSYIPILF